MAVILPKKDTDAAILCVRAFCTLVLISIIIGLTGMVIWNFIVKSNYDIVVQSIILNLLI